MKNKNILFDGLKISEILGDKYNNLCDLISDKVGIINAILERNELADYGFYMYQCLSTNTQKLFNLERDVTSGGLGVSKDKKSAILGCLGEAIERYCMTYSPDQELKIEYLKNLDSKHKLNNFYTYSKEQYRELGSRFSNPYIDKIHWTKIYSVSSAEDYKYWPASLIYLPFNKTTPISETSSTGMAANFNLEDAICSGLCELLERDALMINFLQRLNPPEVDINTINDNNKTLVEKILKEYKVKIYKMYTDINVPVYFSLIWKGKGKKLHYGIGASASLDSEQAIEKSLKECLFTYFYSEYCMDLRQKNADKICTLYEHFLYYQKENFNMLLFDSEKITYQREITTLDKVIKDLKELGIEVYYKELTTTDIVNTNFKVVKVIAPGLVDLNKTHLLPRLGANRLWDVPKKLGLNYYSELSDMPHPFP